MAKKRQVAAKAPPQVAAKAPPTLPATPAAQDAPAPQSAGGPAAPTGAAKTANKAPKAPKPRPAASPDPEDRDDPEDPERPDPDQPPLEGVAERASVYSEWLNRPAPPPTWLNSPPRKSAARPAAQPAEPPDPMRAVLNDQPPPSLASVVLPSPARPAPRRRTTARHITDAERLSVTSAGLEAITRAGAAIPTAPAAPPAATPAAEPAAKMSPAASFHAAPPAASVAARTTGQPAASAAPASPVPHPRYGPAVSNGAPVPPMPPMPPVPPMPPGQRSTARPAGLPATLGQTAERAAIPRTPTAARLPATHGAAHGAAHGAIADPPAARPAADAGSLLIRGSRRPPVTTGPVAPRRKGPPPIVAQGLVALGTIILLLVALTITSPLGVGAAISGTFQAATRGFTWVPTPTPTPQPTPIIQNTGGQSYSPGAQVVIAEIQTVFGPSYAQGALNVARCESGYDPNARNPFAVGDSHAEGVFQILYPSTWDGTSYAAQNPYDYTANIHAAYEIFSRDGYSWREWECQP